MMARAAAAAWSECQVVESVLLTPQARRITLERATPLGRPADPGTHLDVQVSLPSGEHDVRSYSIVESDARGRRITLTVQLAVHSRGGSSYMHSLEVGSTVRASAPLQDFPFVPGADRYVLLAGGIGVTALVGAARLLERLGLDYRVVYVGRTREAMAYADLLADEHGDRLTLHVDDEGTPLDVDALVEEVAGASGRVELLMCGPVRLMDAVRRAWTTAELPAVDLRFETFGSSGWFEAETFEVELPEHGVTATVAPGQSMLDALRDAGAELMWDCRKGECGLCAMRVTALTGEIDHRDVFLSEQQKQSAERLCTCVTRVVAGGTGTGRVSLTTL